MPINPFKLITGTKYTAIDFGHQSLKAAQCKVKGDSIELIKLGKQNLPSAAIKNGRINDFSLVAEELKQLFERLSIKGKNLIFSPAVGQEFVRKHEMPLLPKNELHQALRWEVEEYLNLPPEKVATDFIILKETEENTEVLLVVLPEDVLEGYQQVFSQLNITPKVANVQELALISLLSHQNELSEPSLIINMGRELTRIVIAREDDFFLSRSVEVGGKHFTKIFKREDISWQKAEQAKKKAEISAEETGNSEAKDIDLMISDMETAEAENSKLLRLGDELAEEVARSLEYYNNRFSQETISGCFITGGGFLLKGLKTYLESELEINLQEIDPLTGIEDSINNNKNKELMAVVLGLVVSEVLYHES